MKIQLSTYSSVIDGLAVPYVIVQPDGKIVFANDALCQLIMYTKEDVYNINWNELCFPLTDKKYVKQLQRVLQYQQELYSIRKKNKQAIPVEINTSFINTEDGSSFNLYCITDVSDKVKMLSEIISGEEKYLQLFLNNPMCIIIWDLFSLKILDVNESACREYGYTKEEFLQLSALDIKPSIEWDILKQFADQFARTDQKQVSGVWKQLNKQKQTLLMEVVSHKIEFGESLAVMDMSTNVSEKMRLAKSLEEERALKQKQITEAVVSAQEKERAEISQELHDNVNQLLIASRIYIESARKNTENKEEFLDQSSHFVLKAIEEIRKLSKALNTPMMDNMSLQAAVESLAKDIVMANPVKIKTIVTSLVEDDINEKFKLNVYRIVQEQLNNIIKHSKATHAEIHLTRGRHEIKIMIMDNGVGFDTNSKSGGVGLSNIFRRSEMYNGFVDIQSAPGKGCVLTVKFGLNHTILDE
ncbi:MAG: PAS domain S-box protein [Bacteroidota bacterium]|nr:PAS domain S-box protein [Bacteroidota bacterium]